MSVLLSIAWRLLSTRRWRTGRVRHLNANTVSKAPAALSGLLGRHGTKPSYERYVCSLHLRSTSCFLTFLIPRYCQPASPSPLDASSLTISANATARSIATHILVSPATPIEVQKGKEGIEGHYVSLHLCPVQSFSLMPALDFDSLNRPKSSRGCPATTGAKSVTCSSCWRATA